MEQRGNLEPLHHAAARLRHDANNAMMVLASNLELLARAAATDAARRQVGRAEEAATRLDSLLRATLGMLGRAAGAEALAPQQVVREALPVLTAVLGTRTPVEVTGEAPSVSMDRSLLETALLRLALAQSGKGAAGVALRIVISAQGGEAILVATPPEGEALRLAWPLDTALSVDGESRSANLVP